MTDTGMEAVARALVEEGGALAELAGRPGELRGDEPRPAQIAARGPRAAGHREQYELLLELILEGSRLHYGTPLMVRTADRDLSLLLGDQLYAMGLVRLAGLGDLEAILELADVISLVAQAQAACQEELAEAIWMAGAVAIGWGSTHAHRTAKDLARAEDPRALGALRAAAELAARDGRIDVDDTLPDPFN